MLFFKDIVFSKVWNTSSWNDFQGYWRSLEISLYV